MNRHVTAASLAVALLVGAAGRADAHGGYGFGVGIGVSFNFSGWTFNPCNPCAPSCSTCCCVIPGWSPCYPPPTMYGGLQELLSHGHGAPAYNGWHHAPPPMAGAPAAAAPAGPDKAAGK